MKTLIRTINWMLFTLLCFGVAYYAFTYLNQSYNPDNPFHKKFAISGWVAPMHFYAAGLALILVPFQFNNKLRLQYKQWHRTLGLLYMVCILLGGVSGFLMGLDATGGWVAKSGFTTLAVVWIFTSFQALRFALQGDIVSHKRWIYRSAALTAAGITLRLFLGVGIGVFQWPFMTVYIPTAWLCWTINLLICELIIHRKKHQHLAAATT